MNKDFYRANPNGNEVDQTTTTKYCVSYNEYKKLYYLSITPCTLTEYGFATHLSDHFDKNVTMFPVKRRSAKVQKTCEEWLELHIDNINDAFINNGMQGVKDYFTQHWLAI